MTKYSSIILLIRVLIIAHMCYLYPDLWCATNNIALFAGGVLAKASYYFLTVEDILKQVDVYNAFNTIITIDRAYCSE